MSVTRTATIPLTVVGGYLGAGKTTLLNRMLRDADRRIAVLVNDFGAIDIDGDLISSRAGETLSLTNGCICCGLSGEFMFALAGLRDRDDPPQQVVVEASGIGDPAAIAAYGELPGFRRDAVIVVADAETVHERAEHPTVGSQVLGQLRAADLLVLSKVDLVSVEARRDRRAWLRERAPYAGIVDGAFGEAPMEVLLGEGEGRLRPAGAGAGDAPATPDYASWSWEGEEPVHGHGLVEALKALPADVLRAKGTLHLREDPSSRYLLQLAGRRWSIQRDRAWAQGERRRSRLVMIGLPEAIRPAELTATMRRLAAPAGFGGTSGSTPITTGDETEG